MRTNLPHLIARTRFESTHHAWRSLGAAVFLLVLIFTAFASADDGISGGELRMRPEDLGYTKVEHLDVHARARGTQMHVAGLEVSVNDATAMGR